MKKTVLAIGLVLALSLSVAAASFEFYGGGSYNTFDPKALNDVGKAGNGWFDEFKVGDKLPDGLTVTEFEEIKSGFGAFGGVRYWVNPTMGIGGEIEYFGAKSEASIEAKAFVYDDTKTVNGSIDGSINASVTGFSGAGAFKASPELTVFASAGYYYLNGDVEIALDKDMKVAMDEIDTEFPKGKSKFNDSGLGFKAGVAYAYPVADELSILGRVAYRSLKFDEVEFDKDNNDLADLGEVAGLAKEEIDFSGLEVGLGIVYSF